MGFGVDAGVHVNVSFHPFDIPISAVIPAAQTAAAAAAGYLINNFTQYSVSWKSAVIFGGVASYVDQLFRSLFGESVKGKGDASPLQYAGTVVGPIAGYFAARALNHPFGNWRLAAITGLGVAAVGFIGQYFQAHPVRIALDEKIAGGVSVGKL